MTGGSADKLEPGGRQAGTMRLNRRERWSRARRTGGRKGREDGEREDGRRKETKSLNLGCYRFGHGV